MDGILTDTNIKDTQGNLATIVHERCNKAEFAHNYIHESFTKYTSNT